MLISNVSRQCVIKLRDYSNKKNNVSRPNRTQSSSDSKTIHLDDNQNNSTSAITPLVSGSNLTNRNSTGSQLNDESRENVEDTSCLGRLLNCKPCRKVTERQDEKDVG